MRTTKAACWVQRPGAKDLPANRSIFGSTPVGGQLAGEVTFTDTGTPLTVSAVHTPATPFEATGLPNVGAKIKTGETIKDTSQLQILHPR